MAALPSASSLKPIKPSFPVVISCLFLIDDVQKPRNVEQVVYFFKKILCFVSPDRRETDETPEALSSAHMGERLTSDANGW